MVARACSAGEDTASNDVRLVPEINRPVPVRAASSSRRSPTVSPNASPTASMACGACLSRIWVAALDTTAWPRSVPSTSTASWVTTVRPALRLRAALDMRNRNRAPSPSRISSHPSSTTTRRRRSARVSAVFSRYCGGRSTCRQTWSRASRVPTVRSSSGRCRSDHTTRCPSGRCVVGPSNRSLKEPTTHGASRAASSLAAGSGSACRLAVRSASSGAGRPWVDGSAVMPASR